MEVKYTSEPCQITQMITCYVQNHSTKEQRTLIQQKSLQNHEQKNTRTIPIIKRVGITYICIELTNEAGEVTVLEVARKKGCGELAGVPNDKAVASSAPRYNRVRRRVFHHFKRLGKKRRRTHIVQPLHGLRREARRRRRRR